MAADRGAHDGVAPRAKRNRAGSDLHAVANPEDNAVLFTTASELRTFPASHCML